MQRGRLIAALILESRFLTRPKCTAQGYIYLSMNVFICS